MKISPTFYAKAFVNLAGSTPTKELPDVAARFWRLVFRRKHFGWRAQILTEVARLASEAHGVLTVNVASAHELTDAQQTKLARELGVALDSKVELVVEHKPHLLAGTVVTVGDKRYDASLKGRLDSLCRTLAGERS